MRVLVVYCHPVETSFHAALHQEVLRNLHAAGHEIDDCDLYAEGFDPVLSAAERRGYHTLPDNRTPSEAYIRRVERAEALVLSYPTWSFGLPAILKGFFDRVFIPGVSFTLQDGIARPNLTRIRKIAGISTYGRPRWNALLVADPPRMAVTRYLKALTGWRASVEYHALYDMNRVTEARGRAFLARVRRGMAQF